MKITEVRVQLLDDSTEKLRGFCSITFNDDFVVRDIKIIEGPHGLFVAMPSRKIMDHCPRCKGKNHLRAKFCNDCGARLNPNRATRDPRGRARLHLDVAHPINPRFRSLVERTVLRAYEEEVKRSKKPGYTPSPTPDDEARMKGSASRRRPEAAEKEDEDPASIPPPARRSGAGGYSMEHGRSP